MTTRTLIWRSLRFHARAHLGVVLGAAVGSAALIGALIVGDSVRGSLRERALERLDGIEYALAPSDRFFRDNLRFELESAVRQTHSEAAFPASTPKAFRYEPPAVAAALTLSATANRQDNSARANHVQLLSLGPGIDHFVHLPSLTNLPSDAVLLNAPLAAQLKAAPGDWIVLRVRKPSALSREAVISPQSDSSVALRLKVHSILEADSLGNFNLVASQLPPLNAFVRADVLQNAVDLRGRANLLLAGSPEKALLPSQQSGLTERLLRFWHDLVPGRNKAIRGALPGQPVPTKESLRIYAEALRSAWKPEDAEVEFRFLPEASAIELRSRRIFLDPPIAAAALAPKTSRMIYGGGILTYLANQFRAEEQTTPYSMVTAAGPPWTPPDMKDDEILINQWLADDLQVAPGAEILLTYFLPDSGSTLVEATNRFRVRAVVPLSGPHGDRTLMPDFPGIAKAESTHDWDAGFPLVHKIRPKDDDYWKQYRGTPKAFVTLAAGQRMWGNRFGNLTAVRWAVPGETDAGQFQSRLKDSLMSMLDPAVLGLQFEPVRERALAAANQAQDFGQLFLGFSFFLIVAALILMGLLFQFELERRKTETGTLLALGFTAGQVRWLLLREGIALAALGGAVGLIAGTGFARAILHALTTIWSDAVGNSALRYHATARSLIVGFLASVIVSAITIALVLRRQAKRSARELLAEGGEGDSVEDKRRSPNRARFIAAATGAGAAGLVCWALWTRETSAAGIFFAAGALLLVAGLAFVAAFLAARGRAESVKKMSVSSLGLRGVTRRRKRSLATVGLLACGSFLIVAIGAFKLDANRDASKRSSGTGGFALIGEASLPVVQDLNSKAGRELFGLDTPSMEGVDVVQLRVRDGDDASCLNLNRAQTPRLLGVRPELLKQRGAFTFVKAAQGRDLKDGWALLGNARPKNAGGQHVSSSNSTHLVASDSEAEVPAIGDQNSILWAMGKKVGDTLDFVDERGRPFRIRLVAAVANSILQGSLLISEEDFVARFPGNSGYRMFLIDAPSNRVAAVSATLTRALQDVGLELTPAMQRLAAFNAVQNTYLNTFQVLGGIGLLLGSAGLGVVVLRNVLERRGELALLQAVGFRRRTLHWLVLSEHGGLLLLGLAAGVVAALAAILPTLLAPGAQIHYLSLAGTLGAVLFSGMLWTWIATSIALRGELLKALRNE